VWALANAAALVFGIITDTYIGAVGLLGTFAWFFEGAIRNMYRDTRSFLPPLTKRIERREIPDPIAQMVTFKAKRREQEDKAWWVLFEEGLGPNERLALRMWREGSTPGQIYSQTGVNVHYIKR
jgi:hypothetical protein